MVVVDVFFVVVFVRILHYHIIKKRDEGVKNDCDVKKDAIK